MTEHARRRWVLSPVQVPLPGPDGTIRLRTTTPDDDESLANLLSVAYDANAIDYDSEADYTAEIRTWRTIDHADDAASRVADIDGAILGASLISSELSVPFLYEVATTPTHRRRGISLALLSESVRELAQRSEPAIAA